MDKYVCVWIRVSTRVYGEAEKDFCGMKMKSVIKGTLVGDIPYDRGQSHTHIAFETLHWRAENNDMYILEATLHSDLIKAHNRTDKTMITLASKPLPLLYGSVGSTGLLDDGAAGVAAAGCASQAGMYKGIIYRGRAQAQLKTKAATHPPSALADKWILLAVSSVDTSI
ncbi:hypothetical protein Cgig2_026570 [Carnegiea gigantea]|uniref:Uncharacterized protein n=1 Tax=Carnegiea gigantea TaxID=171969 RepID=A0A9Q1JZG4_9CARY|nr:hypothetical protein Cgig2_026570 [Carnegiea gigantea]